LGRYLSLAEREEIAILKATGAGVRAIAQAVGRSPSTISRELRRNAATRGGKLDYRASVAQWKAELFARRPKVAKLVANPRLQEYVQDRLSGQIRRPDGGVVPGPQPPRWTGQNKPHRKDRGWVLGWSPEQIAHRIGLDFPDDDSMRISHEAIYQALFTQSRGALHRELILCLRTGRALRMPRARSKRVPWAHVTADVLNSERPAEAEDRAIPGHHEGDLIIGINSSAIGTVVERTTGFTTLVHQPREDGWREQLRCVPSRVGVRRSSFEVLRAADEGFGNEHDSRVALQELSHCVDERRCLIGGEDGDEHGEGVVLVEQERTGMGPVVPESRHSGDRGVSGCSG
jgi:IS30 family transposase